MIPIGNPRLLRTAVPFDRCAYLIDLALGMSARIARIGNEISDWTVGHGQPRGRFRCRYFVTIQSSQTPRFRSASQYAVSAGISAHSLVHFWSLPTFPPI